ncbi:MAG: hypothetical protein GY884_35550, partial [Proteobacteria bacterium]|nr:hypothetical protein [Pseudomonadota bacterium]
LALFSHGNAGIEVQTYFLCEHLASHGWMVVAMRHTGNSLLDFDQSQVPVMFLLRPLDVIATLDALTALPTDDPLAGRVGEDVVVAGHSFGGYTTLAVGGATIDVAAIDATCAADETGACDTWTEPRRQLALAGFLDERVDALVPMAPWRVGGVLGPLGTSSVVLPTLLMTASLDETTPDAIDGDPIWDGLLASGGEHARLSLTTAGHYTFSIACDFGFQAGDGCGDGFIPSSDAYPIISAYTLAWYRRHLEEDASVDALLDGDETLSDMLVLTVAP